MPGVMPVFTLKAKDLLAVHAIEAYRDACVDARLFDQAAEVEKALEEFRDWEAANPEQMKYPDHEHVPCAQ